MVYAIIVEDFIRNSSNIVPLLLIFLKIAFQLFIKYAFKKRERETGKRINSEN